jgi:quercetin dioxygenase-like cupin family protein
MKRMILLVVVALSTVICAAQSEGAKTLVLEKNEGEARMRRPRGSLPIPTAEFILKVTPQNSGSKHLVLGTEDIPPRGEIPRHKHLEQDEILLVQTGTAHVTLGAREYDVHAGGTVFFPAQTWVSLKNIRYRQHQPGLYLLRPRFRREHAVRIRGGRAGRPSHQHRRTQGLRS